MATMAAAVEMGRHEAISEMTGRANVAKNVLLFFAAPLIGLAYIIAFPFVGVAAAVKILVRG